MVFFWTQSKLEEGFILILHINQAKMEEPAFNLLNKYLTKVLDFDSAISFGYLIAAVGAPSFALT
jgi:hypothetical protein